MIRFLTVYIWIALITTVFKVGTPLLETSSWLEVLVVLPAGATCIWWLHGFLVRKLEARRARRQEEP